MKTKEKKNRPVSSQTCLLRVLFSRLAAFGWENTYTDYYRGGTVFRHRDGSVLEFATVRELMKFEREASHRKIY